MQRLIAPIAALVFLPAVVFSPALAVLAGPTVQIKNVRVSAGPDGTRIAMDLSARAEHTVFSLDNPDRVVIDVASSTLRGDAPAGEGVVRNVRFGDRDDGGTRIVLDVSERVKPRSSVEPFGAGYRLTVALGGAPAPAAAVELKPVKAAHAPPKSAARDLVIAIDAGHGGVDPGAIGRGGAREKDISLAISRLLAKRIDREEGMRAVLIRDSDHFLSLRERRDRALKHKADLFVSVHADAVHDRRVSGSSVYILSVGRASSEEARMLADKENASDRLGGVPMEGMSDTLRATLIKLQTEAMLPLSLKAGRSVLDQLDQVGEVRKPLIQQASLAVLTSPAMPSILVETAYISNPADEKRLKNPAHQQKLANAIHAGIRAYFRDNPPEGSLFAELRQKKRVAGGEGAR